MTKYPAPVIAFAAAVALAFAVYQPSVRPSGGADSAIEQLAVSVAYPDTGLSSISSFDVYAEGGAIHALVSGTTGSDQKQQLRYLRSEDGGATWQQPRTIETGTAPPYNPDPGNSVQIAASGNRVIAAWETKGSGWGEYGPIVTARSEDGGNTWQVGTHPDESVVGSEQSFLDITADSDGVFHIVWLDGRPAEKGTAAAVVYASSTEPGWRKPITIDGATCTCCPNRIASGPSGRVSILYRDAKPRDMSIAHSANGGVNWSAGTPAGQFEWAFDGCPHVGGGLVDTGDVLHATVWTGREDRIGLYHIASRDGGAHWSSPIQLGGATAKHSELAAVNGGGLFAVWDEAQSDRWAIRAACSSDFGRSWRQPQTLKRSQDTISHPKVMGTHLGARVLWIEEGKRYSLLATAALPDCEG